MRVIMLTDYRGFFRQRLDYFKSLDKAKIINIFNKNNIKVKEYKFEELINYDINLENEIVIYTSSQEKKYKDYIEDILYEISKNNTLVPRFDIFKAHENKGYQEILKRDCEIESLNSYYLGNLDGLDIIDKCNISFPIILKSNEGAGSSNVYKVSSKTELKSLIKKINRLKNFELSTVKKYIKKYIFYNKYGDDIFNGGYVLQEFMSGLNDDWKILIFNDKYYLLNRKTRDNDFRASGSGSFSYIDPPKDVLEYAHKIYKKLDVPFISLDVGYDGERCNLIEFQGVHFGPYTLINSPWYYKYESGNWSKIKGESNLEEEYAYSYIKYITRKINC